MLETQPTVRGTLTAIIAFMRRIRIPLSVAGIGDTASPPSSWADVPSLPPVFRADVMVMVVVVRVIVRVIVGIKHLVSLAAFDVVVVA
jgi:hypothetical protein